MNIQETIDRVTEVGANVKKFRNLWQSFANESVDVQEIGAAYYGFCSELAALRIYKHYQGKIRCEFSKPKNSWYVTLD